MEIVIEGIRGVKNNKAGGIYGIINNGTVETKNATVFDNNSTERIQSIILVVLDDMWDATGMVC